jgi:hypothetical protein
VKNSVSQIACFLFPVLVLASLFFDERLTFVIDPVYLGALALRDRDLADHRRRQGRAVRGVRARRPVRRAASFVWYE